MEVPKITLKPSLWFSSYTSRFAYCKLRLESTTMPSMGIEKNDKKKMKKKPNKEIVETPTPTKVENKSNQDSKKRKSLDTKPSSEVEAKKKKQKKKSKKAKVQKEETNMSVEEEEDKNIPNAISKFRILKPLKGKLKEKKIKSLSPIGAKTFDSILDGFDLLAQAPADQDKTLAFVLPILESLVKGSAEKSKNTEQRTPSVMVLLPTRESAVQVLKEFGFYGGSLGLVSCCVYGGSSHKVQAQKLKRGRVDIIVGTPGRVKDHIEKGNLDLSSLKFRVLGEADELWKEGLVKDVEFILGKFNDVTKAQTLLFSTKLPRWVEKIVASKYLKSNYKEIELVSNEQTKTTPSKGSSTEGSNQAATVHSNYGNRW